MPIVKYLVEGAHVELRAVSKDVLTPLLCAMINNRADVASFLVRKDAGLLEIADSNGDYPLHLCVLENLPDMMVTLLREGADPLKVNTRGETALTVAEDVNASDEMMQILEQAQQEAEAQAVELKAAELEAEADAVLEHGDAKGAAEKWREAAELYAQVARARRRQHRNAAAKQAL
jgi:ankyrin repeat protein